MEETVTKYSALVRTLATTALLITGVDFGYGLYVIEIVDENTAMLMSMSGMNAVFSPPGWSFYAYYAVQVFVLIMLIVDTRGAKLTFTLSLIFFAITSVLFGISVSHPIGILLATVLAYLYGGILALLFLPNWESSDWLKL